MKMAALLMVPIPALAGCTGPRMMEIDGVPDRGMTVVECTVRPDGTMATCEVLRETPPGCGFGAASMAAALRSRVAPGNGGKLRFNTRFRLAEPIQGEGSEAPGCPVPIPEMGTAPDEGREPA